MKIRLNEIFSSGEMASYSRISKDALFFYEEKGLIKPNRNPENGYRYYTLENFYQLDMIACLKAAGASIEEIQNYAVSMHGRNYTSIIKDRLKYIKEEQKRLAYLQEKLERTIYLTEMAGILQPGTLRIAEKDPEQLIVKPLSSKNGSSAAIFANSFKDFVVEYSEFGVMPDFHLSIMIDCQSLLARDFTPGYIYSAAPSTLPVNLKDVHTFTRPGGKYISYIHKGPYRNLPEIYQNTIIPFIEAQNLKIIGNAYERTLLGWFNALSEDDYITEVMIEVADTASEA